MSKGIKGWGLLAGFAVTVLLGCFKQEDNPHGTEVENEVVGALYYASGKPAAGANVRLIPVGWNPKPGLSDEKEIRSAITDAKGKFRFDSLGAGEYNMLGNLDSLASYNDSIPVDRETRNLPSDTLDETGSITGFAALQPNHLASTATVEILGTTRFANVEESGRFRFTGLAAGRYSIRLSTTLPEYTPLYTGFTVRAGTADLLPDTLRMQYTGIPVVTGLKVSYDTLSGVARISWKPVSYSLLQDYGVFRDSAGSISLSGAPLKWINDTVYFDTLFHPGPAYASGTDSSKRRVEYRVKARNKSDRVGENFGYVGLEAPSPAWVTTFLETSVQGLSDFTLSPNDTVRIVAKYRNPGRTNDSLFWFIAPGTTPVRISTTLGYAGADTLVYVSPNVAGPIEIRVAIKDQAGIRRERMLTGTVIPDRPTASAGKDTVVALGGRFKLQGSSFQRFGSIVKWEWDIGNHGTFARTTGPDTVIALPTSPDSAYRCVFRVTDDDEMIGMDTIVIVVSPSRLLGPNEFLPYSYRAESKGKIYLIGGDDSLAASHRLVLEYDTATNTVRKRTAMPVTCQPGIGDMIGGGAVAYGDNIYLVGQWAYSITADSYQGLPEMSVYNTVTDTWTTKRAMNHTVFGTAAVVGDKLYVIGNEYKPTGVARFNGVQEYDFATDTWTDKSPLEEELYEPASAVVDGKIFVLNNPNSSNSIYGSFSAFDPASGTWERKPDFPQGERIGRPVVANGKILVFCPAPNTSPRGTLSSAVRMFDPGKAVWTSTFPILKSRFRPQVSAVGNKIFVLGGACVFSDIYSYGSKVGRCDDGEVYVAP